MSFDGIILVDKESGWTSFDVVAKIRGILQLEKQRLHLERGFCMEKPSKDGVSNTVSRTNGYGERVEEQPDTAGIFKGNGVVRDSNEQVFRCKCRVKVGHTGTLDPLATGLMIVVVGTYCKRASEFSKMDKEYEVQMKLGETSTTGDEEGVKAKVQSEKFKEEMIVQTLSKFLGESMQVPPAFSAIKVNGKRAYDLARKGQEVKLEPRKITIYDIKMTKYAFPNINFIVKVSSGTYIRSLVEDIGKSLNTGAYMTALTRTVVGQFDIKDAQKIQNISSASIIETS